MQTTTYRERGRRSPPGPQSLWPGTPTRITLSRRPTTGLTSFRLEEDGATLSSRAVGSPGCIGSRPSGPEKPLGLALPPGEHPPVRAGGLSGQPIIGVGHRWFRTAIGRREMG